MPLHDHLIEQGFLAFVKTSRDGLGLAILLAARSFRSADLFADVALLSFIGYTSNVILQFVARRALRWR